jgi:hypothetical protein
MKCWHIEDLSEAIPLLLDSFHGKAYIDYTSLKPKLIEKIRLKKVEEDKAMGLRLKVTGKANFFH